MFRTAITCMIEDQGSENAKSKPDLKEKIKQMVLDGGPMAALGDWATHIRLYGNAGAHPDLFGDVSVEEAQEVSRLVSTMIEILYVLPAKIAKRQSERQNPKSVQAFRSRPNTAVPGRPRWVVGDSAFAEQRR